jgi:hypothetical protein
MIAKNKKTNIGMTFTSKNAKAKPTESALAMTRDITMIAKNKKTNIGMTFTSKNAKAKPTESANSAKKTNADDIAKKATLKTAGPTKNRTTFTAANIPAFFPEYPDYRLSDIVSTIEYRKDPMGGEYEEVWEEDSDGEVWYGGEHFIPHNGGPGLVDPETGNGIEETLQDYIFRLFPDSIASQYLRTTKRINDMNVLSEIVDGFVKSRKIQAPAEDAMVVHLRVGDVIDGTKVPLEDFLNQRVNSYYALFQVEPPGGKWSPVYVRCLASFDRVLNKTKELGFHKISLVYGFHIKYKIQKSKKYIAYLAQYAQSQGFEVETITDADADVSFAYACCAKHFIPGGGGFSKLMSKVVKHKGNNVYYVKI